MTNRLPTYSARKANRRVVLPEGNDARVVRAAIKCQVRGIAQCILLGDPEEVRRLARAQGIDELPEGLEIISPTTELREKYVAPMVELRKHKGMTEPVARAQLEDITVLATMMLAVGEVDGLVSGANHTTANTIRPALQLIKARPNAAIVSSVFFMLLPDQVVLYGDCAINADPNPTELASIAIESAEVRICTHEASKQVTTSFFSHMSSFYFFPHLTWYGIDRKSLWN
jgi:phosphate acetyltransferase